jgi:hypothetical protein
VGFSRSATTSGTSGEEPRNDGAQKSYVIHERRWFSRERAQEEGDFEHKARIPNWAGHKERESESYGETAERRTWEDTKCFVTRKEHVLGADHGIKRTVDEERTIRLLCCDSLWMLMRE